MQETPTPGYRIGWLLGSQAVAVLIVASWLLPPTADWWQAADIACFRALNGLLDKDSLATLTWAWLNVRVADLVPAVMLVVLVLVAAGGLPPRVRERFTHRGLAFAAVLGAVVTVENLIELSVYEYRRPSPTMVLDDVIRLSEVVPAAKDFSDKSFPGDHGFVLICSVIFFLFTMPRWYAATAVMIAIFFTLPRLVAGAHWMTDILVGSGAKAVMVMGWLVATPLWDRCTNGIARLLARLPIDPVQRLCQWKAWSQVEPQADEATAAGDESGHQRAA